MDPNREIANDVESNALAPTQGTAPSENQHPPPPPNTQPVPVAPQGVELLRLNKPLVDKIQKQEAKEFRASVDDDLERVEFWLENPIKRDKSVAEYEAEFLRLSRYARGMVATEYKRCVRFEDDLRDDLRVLIALQRERDFVVLVEKAKIAEYVKCIERQNRELDRPYTICGKHHQGECWVQIGACLRCGFMEHHIRDCPLRPVRKQATGRGRGAGNTKVRQSALVDAAHRREDGDGPAVIMATFFIHNIPYTALIDVGSMHSYIACTVSETLGIMVENTTSQVTVLNSLGQSVRVNKLFKDVPLEVQAMVFLANLMEFPFGEFNGHGLVG
ncbi:uncharacterized protein LOC128283902 [Gossypium arboreum]|uniref:uncharacterized protein LOC128283902 n=1 Tax=Gossypium arboreum TaxID=29729 RepID=UPI0022F15FED|nr:uncharacterized protein LOC128283902 [Gossypium arboreum]